MANTDPDNFGLLLAVEVGRLIRSAPNLESLLSKTIPTIRAGLDLDYVQFFLLDPGRRTLVLRAAAGPQGPERLRQGYRLPVAPNSPAGLAALEKRPVLLSDCKKRLGPHPMLGLPNARSGLAVPLFAADHIVGVLDLYSLRSSALTAVALLSCEALANQLALAIENARLAGESEALATRMSRRGWEASLDPGPGREVSGYSYDLAEITPLGPHDELARAAEAEVLTVPLRAGEETLGLFQVALRPDDRQAAGLEKGRPESGGQEAGQWSDDEVRLVTAVAQQAAQHIQNLQLIAQAGRYRAEAEGAARRLTRQGWEEFLDAIERSETIAYTWDKRGVRPRSTLLSSGSNEQVVTQPIQVLGETVGLFQVERSSEGWSGQQARLLEGVTRQVAQHVENLRLLARAERYRREAEQAARHLTLQGWETYLENVPDLAAGYVYDQNQVRPISEAGTEDNAPAIGAPIQVREQTIGKLAATAPEAAAGEVASPGTAAAEAEGASRLVEAVAGRLGQHIESLRLLEETERGRQQLNKRASELEIVAGVSTATATILDPHELLLSVVELARDRFDLNQAFIFLLSDDGEILELAAAAGEVGRKLMAEKLAISVDQPRSVVAECSRVKKGLIVTDIFTDPLFMSHPLLPDTRSEMAVPLMVGQQLLGVFDVESSQVERFTDEDLRTYTILAAQIAIALQNARRYAEQLITVERLRELDHLKSSFLANMSHELRTPLNSIIGFTQVIAEEIDGPITEYMRTDLQLIEKNGQHLLKLINDVLDMAKIEAGRMTLAREPVILEELIWDVMETSSPLARDKSLYLRLAATPQENLQVTGDPVRLRQVLLNLIGNAIKFTESGGIDVDITKKVDDQGGELIQICIRDTGIGIPADKLNTIFEAFSQVDTSTTRKAGGTGLGLPISRRLVELHGGRLWAESSSLPGEGSTFFLELPVVTPDLPLAD